MSDFQFVPAQKTQRKARVAFIGPAGCGKTMSALLVAQGLVGPKGRIGVIDTEHGSASLYSRIVPFDVLRLEAPFTPARYAQAAKAAATAGFDVLIVDSMSQEWNGEGGVLQMVEARKTQVRNDFAAWNGPSQEHERFLEVLVSLPIHIISTFQAKTDYAMTTDNGRTKVEKLGLGAVTREGVEYRMDLVLEMTIDHKAVITKSRIPDFADQVITKPNAETGAKLRTWLDDGAPEVKVTPQTQVVDDATARTGYRKDGNGSATKDGYVDTLPVLEGRIAESTLTMIATMGRNAPETLRTAFYEEFLEPRGFTGETYAKKWKAFVERGTNSDAADAVTFLGAALETA